MNTERAAQPHFVITIVLFALAFLAPSWPWLSGAVTVPYDAKSSVLPPIEFMAHAFATGASPFWTFRRSMFCSLMSARRRVSGRSTALPSSIS
jgi:hypothetical protein